jgi:acylphosphatase
MSSGDSGRTHAATPLIRRHVLYRGTVQGVGFRYTARSLAGSFAVSGYVRNLPDGTVELEVQGALDDVQGLLDAIAVEMGGYIRDTQSYDVPPTGSETGFVIRH